MMTLFLYVCRTNGRLPVQSLWRSEW